MFNKVTDYIQLDDFPPDNIGESPAILKKLGLAREKLAFLDAIHRSLPNPKLILHTLPLQEAQDSSAIESIVTTSDELYQGSAGISKLSVAAKEVRYYLNGLELGAERMQQNNGIIRKGDILAIQKEIVGNDAGIRDQAGTVIKNTTTEEVIYTPPQDPKQIHSLLDQLLEYINVGNGEDPLIKMALIHHQFESIHPFFDGNGRTGRILNLLYLMKSKRLASPILYLSRFINHNKSEYYRLLQTVRKDSNWEEWVIYVLNGITHTAMHATDLVMQIQELFNQHKNELRDKHNKIYSHELLNHIYAYPYTRIAHMSKHLDIDPRTATKYLNQLSDGGLLTKTKIEHGAYYINHKLYNILTNTPSLKMDSLKSIN